MTVETTAARGAILTENPQATEAVITPTMITDCALRFFPNRLTAPMGRSEATNGNIKTVINRGGPIISYEARTDKRHLASVRLYPTPLEDQRAGKKVTAHYWVAGGPKGDTSIDLQEFVDGTQKVEIVTTLFGESRETRRGGFEDFTPTELSRIAEEMQYEISDAN